MKARVFPRRSAQRFSTCSTPQPEVIVAGRAPGSAWRSARVWWVLTVGISVWLTGLKAAVLASLYSCHCRPSLAWKANSRSEEGAWLLLAKIVNDDDGVLS